MSRKAHKAERKTRKEAERGAKRLAQQMAHKPFRGILTRWRCARRCGAGDWTPRLDIPQICPNCGASVDIER